MKRKPNWPKLRCMWQRMKVSLALRRREVENLQRDLGRVERERDDYRDRLERFVRVDTYHPAEEPRQRVIEIRVDERMVSLMRISREQFYTETMRQLADRILVH